MATYLKRTSKLYDLTAVSRPVASVALRDLMCPVCRGILIEPVTLPCTHNLCLSCLRGTFEHNSLSCPLCRLRVGSWLRTATKSETLVNGDLWQLIQQRFPKEVQEKHTSSDRDVSLDAVTGFAAATKILSATGEIRREYEAQLQIAEEEIRRQREAEKLASETFIRKIQAEEQQQQLAQLAQDQLLAKSLAKKQALEKQKPAPSWYRECKTPEKSSGNIAKFDLTVNSGVGVGDNAESLRTNPGGKCSQNASAPSSNSHTEKDKMKDPIVNATELGKDRPTKYHRREAEVSAGEIKNRTLFASGSSPQPGPSSASKAPEVKSKGSRDTKVAGKNEKKLSSGEDEDDEDRCESSESDNSHDSISHEMVHFKPIMTVPRTPFRILKDGTEIRPLFFTITPAYRRISGAKIKPPSQIYAKLIIRSQWSAFCGQARQRFEAEKMIEKDIKCPSTSRIYPEVEMVESAKAEVVDLVPSPDSAPEVSCDDNENYAKNTNRLINGVKGAKKKSLEGTGDTGDVGKTWKHRAEHGLKSKRERNAWANKKDGKCGLETKNLEDNETGNSTSSSTSTKTSPQEDEREQDDDLEATENIAERIKKRKINVDRKNAYRISNASSEPETLKRSTRKRLCGKEELDYSLTEDTSAVQKRVKKFTRVALPRTKRQKASRRLKANMGSPEKSDSSTDTNYRAISYGLRKSARNLKHAYSSSTSSEQDGQVASKRYNYSSESCSETQDNGSEFNNGGTEADAEKCECSDDDVIKEQERMERLVLQEKEDFELARRLQAKFDEMEGIAGRTRRSRRRAIESSSLVAELCRDEFAGAVEKTGLYTKR